MNDFFFFGDTMYRLRYILPPYVYLFFFNTLTCFCCVCTRVHVSLYIQSCSSGNRRLKPYGTTSHLGGGVLLSHYVRSLGSLQASRESTSHPQLQLVSCNRLCSVQRPCDQASYVFSSSFLISPWRTQLVTEIVVEQNQRRMLIYTSRPARWFSCRSEYTKYSFIHFGYYVLVKKVRFHWLVSALCSFRLIA